MKDEFVGWAYNENALRSEASAVADRVSTIDDKIEKYNQKIEKLNKKIKELEKGKPLYAVGDRVILADAHYVVKIKKVTYDKKEGYTYWFDNSFHRDIFVLEKDIFKKYSGDNDYIEYLLSELWKVESILQNLKRGIK